MENTKYLVDEIRHIIKTTVHPCYENTGRTELYCRCPKCGDSRKSKTSAHFYIEMKPPFKYYCQRCSASGRLDNETLHELQIFNNDLVLKIIQTNKETMQNSGFKPTTRKKNFAREINEEDNEITKYNIAYLNSRFETNLDREYINKKFKCISDIPLFLSQQKLSIKTPANLNLNKAIGFISSDGSHMVVRNTDPEGKLRYSNVNLTGGDDDTASKIYNMSASVDVLQPKINLVITEGIFDIIGVYLALYKDTPEEENTIFAAACGKSFSTVIMNYIKKGFLDLNITIYSDSDVDISYYQNIKKSNIYIKNWPLIVCYNTISKDCGVPSNQIKINKAII